MSEPLAPPAPSRTRATDLALVAVMAALVAVCAVAPPVPTGVGVPVTLQTFGVLLAGLVLGARRGAAAAALYVAVGLAGVPVLAGGTGGPGVLAGPTAGYLLAFVPAAAVAGALGGLARRVAPRWRYAVLAAAGLVAGLAVIHPAGIAGLVVRTGLPLRAAVVADLAFVPGDALKALVAAAVAAGVLRAFPGLLRER
jgi:biotin transport system substrate-specific component